MILSYLFFYSIDDDGNRQSADDNYHYFYAIICRLCRTTAPTHRGCRTFSLFIQRLAVVLPDGGCGGAAIAAIIIVQYYNQ
jgi:hypothetical protein